MRKFLVNLVLLTLTTCLLLGGCGSSQMAQVGNPNAFFEKAREGIGGATSFRMTGKMVMNYSDLSGSRNMRINYDMLFEKQGDNFIVKMDMEMPAQSSGFSSATQGEKVEVYMTKDKMYMQMPTGEWFYKGVDLGLNLTGVDQSFSPQSMLQMLDAARTVEVVEENPFFTRYYLTLDPEKLTKGANIEDYLERMNESGIIQIDVGEYTEMIRNVLSQMEIYLTVDKVNGYPMEFDMIFDKNILDYMGSFFEGNPLPEGTSITMSMNFAIGDYGKVFNLQLPEKALQAKPLEELTGNSTSF